MLVRIVERRADRSLAIVRGGRHGIRIVLVDQQGSLYLFFSYRLGLYDDRRCGWVILRRIERQTMQVLTVFMSASLNRAWVALRNSWMMLWLRLGGSWLFLTGLDRLKLLQIGSCESLMFRNTLMTVLLIVEKHLDRVFKCFYRYDFFQGLTLTKLLLDLLCFHNGLWNALLQKNALCQSDDTFSEFSSLNVLLYKEVSYILSSVLLDRLLIHNEISRVLANQFFALFNAILDSVNILLYILLLNG